MSMSRKELTFASGQDTCAAWFYPATADRGARPIIVMAHGLTGTRRDRLGAFAERFAAAGIAALVFDYRGFGDSTGEPDLFEPSLQLEDWRAAIAFARSLPDIDAGRVATFGSSLGGGQRARRGSGGSQGGRGYQPGSISRQGQPDLHQTSARRGGNEGCSSRRSLFGCRWSAP
jgi:predicted alpha/beta-fold hydrolase